MVNCIMWIIIAIDFITCKARHISSIYIFSLIFFLPFSLHISLYVIYRKTVRNLAPKGIDTICSGFVTCVELNGFVTCRIIYKIR